MITLDKSCTDMLASYVKENTTPGKQLYKKFTDGDISVIKYKEDLYELTDRFLSTASPQNIKEIFSGMDVFKFNAEKAFAKLSSADVATLSAPFIVCRIDTEGNYHFLCTITPREKYDEYITTLNFELDQMNKLLHLVDNAHLKIELLDFPFQNHTCFVFVYGKANSVSKYSKELKKEVMPTKES